MQFNFGSGSLFGVRNDVTPNVPIEFGILQDVNIEISTTTKELKGQYQFPVAVGRGAGKITGKAKFGKINGLVFSSLFFGLAQAAGRLLTAVHEAGAVPGVAAYTITVANAAGFVVDLGVTDLNGIPWIKVAAGAEAAGKYSVNNAGVYTFSAADASKQLLLSYTYTIAADTQGNTLTITNPLLGQQPQFQANFTGGYNNKAVNLQLNACVAEKLAFATKLDDFTIPEFDFSAFADGTNTIGKLSFSE